MCQSEAEPEFIYIWRLKPWILCAIACDQDPNKLWWRRVVSRGPTRFSCVIMPRSFLVKRRKSADANSTFDSGKLAVSYIIYFLKLARVVERTICAFCSWFLSRSIGTVHMSTRQNAISLPSVHRAVWFEMANDLRFWFEIVLREKDCF